ncbi:hypothetical protein GCM10009096_03590 [Parasphingorhabdus litoris]|uniref:Uncharacterized protein n=1 Tax=Parasphingorhabdus litoris TaxID=394733 RepID=A0ABN1A2T5_9SPHN|nr:hypothetical protein [Parasphingorhabdus litoris]
MKRVLSIVAASSIAISSGVAAQAEQAEVVETAVEESAGAAAEATAEAATEAAAVPVAKTVTVPADTIVVVTPTEEITSKKMKEGTERNFRVAEAVVSDGVTVIPLNSPVVGTVSWRTGKGIFGKSAKFEITFDTVTVDGTEYSLRGKHRQEGRGNTAAALLVSGIITGRSAVMVPGQLVNAFVEKDITVTQ